VPPNRVWVSGYWAPEGASFRWISGYWSEPAAAQVYYPPPPEMIVEATPPAPNDSSFFVAGTWIYRDSRYLWRPGYWSPYRPGWLWTQPHYVGTPGGYVFVDGYWDYDFQRRGVLFAPAYFGPQYYGGNGFYRPSFALATNLLYASLFVQPNASYYYFGNYFGPQYTSLGYTPWLDYRYSGRYADPAWSYYAWQNRGTPRWEEQMRTAYVSRQRGETAAPPRQIDTAAVQPQPKTANATQNVNLVVPIQQLQAQSDVKLRAVTKDDTVVIQRHSEEIRNVARARQKVESKVDAKSSQRVVQADLPLPKAAPRAATSEQPPPLPVLPKVNPDAKPPITKQAEPRPSIPPVTPPTGKEAPPAPKAPPKTAPPPKSKDQPPKTEPKTAPAPQAPLPPSLAPKTAPLPPSLAPKTAPQPQPKIEPKAIPAPKASPTVVPPPKIPQPMPRPIEPKTLPAPQPKAAPAPPPPQLKAPLPVPLPKAAPIPPPTSPAPAPLPKAPPPTPPKVVPVTPAPKVVPRLEPVQPVPPAIPKGKGKDGKDKEKE
jgi:hypothetical protein